VSAYLSVREAGLAYPAIGERYFRRLVQERRIAFHRVGRKVLLARSDIDDLIAAGRVEPVSRLGEWRRRAAS